MPAPGPGERFVLLATVYVLRRVPSQQIPLLVLLRRISGFAGMIRRMRRKIGLATYERRFATSPAGPGRARHGDARAGTTRAGRRESAPPR